MQELYEVGGDRKVKDDRFIRNYFIITGVIGLLLIGFLAGSATMKSVLIKRGQIIDKPTYSIYDLNLDGKVNSSDTNICYDIFTGFRVATPSMLERADVDKSGIVDDKDCTLIMDAILGKVEK